jgi:ribonuclease HI
VKAHVGIYGNEITDRLAKEATQNHHITYSRIPKSAIIKYIRKESTYKKMAELLGGNKERSDY